MCTTPYPRAMVTKPYEQMDLDLKQVQKEIENYKELALVIETHLWKLVTFFNPSKEYSHLLKKEIKDKGKLQS